MAPELWRTLALLYIVTEEAEVKTVRSFDPTATTTNLAVPSSFPRRINFSCRDFSRKVKVKRILLFSALVP